MTQTTLTVLPVLPERWPDLEAVFNSKGCSIARGCWCMYYRVSGKPPARPAGTSVPEASRLAMKRIVDSGQVPGLIGYLAGQPAGWVTLGPREEFRKLARSPVIGPVDDQPVWSLVCFVVPSQYRGQGVAKGLLRGAISYARSQRVGTLEAYPLDTEAGGFGQPWFGSKSMFDEAGFVEVMRRKPQRPIMRLNLA